VTHSALNLDSVTHEDNDNDDTHDTATPSSSFR
jgi:hypothetical protein